MIFIDPSELRQKSNLLKYISDMVYNPLPDLEAVTGADVMISPDGLPFPRNEKMLQFHVDSGSKLIQLKFGHDLPLSIVDGRLNEVLSRMLRITNERSWQCLLLFIGLLGYDDTDGMATVNGQLTYGNCPMRWNNIDIALGYWTDRGGSLSFPLPSGNLIKQRFDNVQYLLNRYANDERTKQIWPKAPVMYDEVEPNNPHLKKWSVAQKLVAIEDIRPLLCSIPGCRIGEKKATAIFNYMAENGIRQDFNGFLDLIRDESILNVPGIGKKILDDIRWGLFRTREERDERNK